MNQYYYYYYLQHTPVQDLEQEVTNWQANCGAACENVVFGNFPLPLKDLITNGEEYLHTSLNYSAPLGTRHYTVVCDCESREGADSWINFASSKLWFQKGFRNNLWIIRKWIIACVPIRDCEPGLVRGRAEQEEEYYKLCSVVGGAKNGNHSPLNGNLRTSYNNID